MPHFCLGGRLPLPTPLMAGLIILKHSYDLSDEGVCKRWIENPYWRHLTGGRVPSRALRRTSI
jgi:hypothetical protein